ncbi:hypothetical protein GCK72_019680 [Caenorhabditis remanei]|nr:hypothetical protein GCK72_019680 [Caenorhabditis remanei]KAF1753124.1 hypothetical protein GCK72_019680 [Caenorhabditis remanei]
MQIAIPAVIIGTPQVLMTILGFLDYSSPEIDIIGYMLMSIHGVSSTLVMLYCHTPYRQFCQSLVGRRLKIFRHHTTSLTVT